MTKGRWLVVVLALILVTLATIGVFLYSVPVKEHWEPPSMVPIVVSKVGIPARTDLDQLIKDNRFRILRVSQEAVVPGAVTTILQLRDGCNRVVILAGEQIPAGLIKRV
jgi:hypothetical protein